MKEPYLEVTFRRGRPIAAYYYLPRRAGQKSYRTLRAGPGMILDLSRNGKPLGIEITAPNLFSHSALNRVLKQYGQTPVARADQPRPAHKSRSSGELML